MKRDRNLMRDLLLKIEECSDPTGLEIESRFEPYVSDSPGIVFISPHGTEARPENRSRDYQLIQLEKAGLIEFVDKQFGPDFVGGRVRLLPAGHDAIEVIADEGTWAKLLKATPREAYEIVKSVASGSAASALSKVMGWN